MNRAFPESRIWFRASRSPPCSNCLKRRAVHLQQVDVVDVHSPQAFVDIPVEVFRRPDMMRATRFSARTDVAAALRGQVEFIPAAADAGADAVLAEVVTRGGVDEVDAGVQHGVEQAVGLRLRDFTPEAGPIAELCDHESRVFQAVGSRDRSACLLLRGCATAARSLKLSAVRR